jgi:hypothetical protein
MQLRGNAAKGYAFDRRYPQDTTSDTIYEDCVSSLVESCFKVRATGCVDCDWHSNFHAESPMHMLSLDLLADVFRTRRCACRATMPQ